MKVADIVHRKVHYVTNRAKVKQIAKIIFGQGISGVPVVEDKKVVGIITEEDILSHMYPTIQDIAEDYVHARNFESMEENIDDFLESPVTSIMTKDVVTITADTPVMEAQSLMILNKFSRLPVTDENGKLIGIISQGDVFRALVGGKLPFEEEESFYDWIAKNYDLIIEWEKRLDQEVPSLTKIFKENNVHKVLDVASSTGEHAIALAHRGLNVVGLERSGVMDILAQQKRSKLPQKLQEKVRFEAGNYSDLLLQQDRDFDAALFMGNGLPHILYKEKNILREVSQVLKQSGSIMVLQIANFDKAIVEKSGLRNFLIRKSEPPYDEEHGFLSFYSREAGQWFYTQAVMDFVGKQWIVRDIHSTPMEYISKEDITAALKKLGFKKLSFYGSSLDGTLLDSPFDPKESDWLNVVAKR